MAKTTIRAEWIQDACVSNSALDSNFSSDSTISLANTSTTYVAYLQMAPYTVPQRKKIIKITLGLWLKNNKATSMVGAVPYDSFSIRTITYRNKPTNKPPKTLGDLPILADYIEQKYDITQHFTIADLVFGIALYIVDLTAVASMVSSDNLDADKRPYVEIEYADAPFRPSVVGPLNGTAIDKAVTPTSRFSWAHNPSDVSQLPQKSYELQWSTDAYTWTTLTATTANAYADVDVSVMPAGAIFWRVRTIDTDDVPSDWSEQQIIRIASIPAAPNILNAVFDKASPKIEWTVAEQSGYQIQILQGAEKLIDTTVTTTDKFFNVPIVLANETQFTIRVRCKNNSDVFSAWAEDAISTAYTAPSIPNLSIIKKKYSVELNITGDAPLYQIYRDTVLIGTTSTGIYNDWSAPFGAECDYKIVAVGEGTAESAAVKGTTDYPNESVLTLVSDPTKTFAVKWNITYSRDISDDGVLVEYAGRELPCLERGEHIARTYTIDAHMTDMTAYESLEEMVENHSLFLFRRKDLTMYGRPTNIVAAKPDYARHDYTLSFVLNEVES